MTIYIGSDHAGFKLKEAMKKYLTELGVKYKDFGAKKLVKTDDYPVYAAKVARAVVKGKNFGILFCDSGQGMCIAANKIKGIRAVVVINAEEAKITRTHNDANVLCLSARKTSNKNAKKIIKTFIFTMFSNEERHKRRIKEIKSLE